METSLKINTGTGQETFTTELIRGKLHCIILRSFEKVEVIIESELGYVIFQNKEFAGTEYIAIRQRTRAPINKLIDVPDFGEFMLNEQLNITLIGPRNNDVDIILRYGE